MMLSELLVENFKRNLLAALLEQCTEAQREFFKKVFPEPVIHCKRLTLAIDTCLRTIAKARGLSPSELTAANLAEMIAPADDEELEARRWRALVACSRVRLLGYARGGPQGRDGPIRHIGFEFTTDELDFAEREAEKKLAVDTLIEFVDGIVPLSAGAAADPAAPRGIPVHTGEI